MITQRAVIIGFVGVCFYLVALVNQLPSYYSILTWLSITILVSCAGVAAISLQGMRCSWRVLRSRAAASLDASATPSANANRVLDSHDDSMENGSGPVVEIELVNKGTLNKTGVMVDVTVRHLTRDVELTRRFMIESLPANSSLISTLTLRGLPRGRYKIVGITLVGADVLGLFRSRQKVFVDGKNPRRKFVPRPLPDPDATFRFYVAMIVMGFLAFLVGVIARHYTIFGGWAATFGGLLSALVGASGLASWWRSVQAMRAPRPRVNWDENAQNQLLVGPATVGAGRLVGAAAAEESGAEAVQFDVLGRGDELRGTRPYVAGDDLRTVHWKSTARLGRLVVKEFHRPARTQCAVIWDGSAGADASSSKGNVPGARSSTRKAIKDLQNMNDDARRVEMALSLTGSLCRAWLERGLSCTLLCLDEGGARLVSQPGGRGLTAAYVEALAEADAKRQTPLANAVAARLRDLPREGDVFLVTTQALQTSASNAILSDDVRRAASVLKSRGGRVTVVVVESAQSSSSAQRETGKKARESDTVKGDTVNRLWTDTSGVRVVSVVPPVDRRRPRRRFAPSEAKDERRRQGNTRLILEQSALSAALETLMHFETRQSFGALMNAVTDVSSPTAHGMASDSALANGSMNEALNGYANGNGQSANSNSNSASERRNV